MHAYSGFECQIIEIDGRNVQGNSVATVRRLCCASTGTDGIVTLKVQRQSGTATVNLLRSEILLFMDGSDFSVLLWFLLACVVDSLFSSK